MLPYPSGWTTPLDPPAMLYLSGGTTPLDPPPFAGSAGTRLRRAPPRRQIRVG